MAQMEEIKIVVSRVNLENVDSSFFNFISFSKTSVLLKMHGNENASQQRGGDFANTHDLVGSLKC